MSVKLVLSVSTLIIAAINIPVGLPSSFVFFYIFFIEVSKKEMQLAMSSRNQEDVSVSEKVTAVETFSTKCLINLTSEFV